MAHTPSLINVSRSVGAFLVCLGILTPAAAQSRVQPTIFGAPGVLCCSDAGATTAHLGGGADVSLTPRFRLVFEGGYLMPWGAVRDGVGNLSAGGAYTIGRSALRPFVAGGYGMFFSGRAAAHAWYGGGGIEYPLTRRVAIRLEARDYIVTDGAHAVSGRVGIVIR